MDYVSITKTNRLFWLGRYYERVSLTLRFIMERYDEMIDTDMFDYHQYCYDLGIPDNYLDSDDFFEKYIFDVDNDFSIRNSAEQMLGNGMVLRETIGSPTLAYLQMAVYSLDELSMNKYPLGLGLQQVIDNIMAFRGSYDDFIEDDSVRNTIKCGASIELMSFCLRTRFLEEALPTELHKFLKRLPRCNLPTDALSLQALVRQSRIYEGKYDAFPLEKRDYINAVESLFIV